MPESMYMIDAEIRSTVMEVVEQSTAWLGSENTVVKDAAMTTSDSKPDAIRRYLATDVLPFILMIPCLWTRNGDDESQLLSRIPSTEH